MPDLNDLNRPLTSDTEPNVLDTLRAHIVRAATWAGWSATANKVAGLMSGVTAAVSGGRSLRLYRRNDANTADEEVVSLPGISVGGNAGTASAAQAGSTLRADLDARAPLNSPAFTGTPIAPTAAAGTNTTQLATTAFVRTAVAGVVNSSPAALDTLNELAAALGNDPNFATSTATALGNRVTKESNTRPGVTRLYRADADSDFSVQTTYDGTRWFLRGYAGAALHAECRVGYADSAGSAGTASNPASGGSFITSLNIGNQSVNYASSAGNASTVSNVTTSQVLNAAAGASAGGVGTYVLAIVSYVEGSYGGDTEFWGLRAGDQLMPTSAAQTVSIGNLLWSLNLQSASKLTGTWRCMGYFDFEYHISPSYARGATLWLRIA